MNINIKKRHGFPPEMVAYFYLVCQRGEGHILDDIGFSGILSPHGCMTGTPGENITIQQFKWHCTIYKKNNLEE